MEFYWDKISVMSRIPLEDRPVLDAARIKRDTLRHDVLNARTLEEMKRAVLRYIEELAGHD